MKNLILLFSIANIAHAGNSGFGAGDAFEQITAHGNMSLECRDGNENSRGTYTCNTASMTVNRSYFISDPLEAADHVSLTATHANGEISQVNKLFDGHAGKTVHEINLNALLTEGLNHIHYALLGGAKTLREGDFQVSVKTGRAFECPTRAILSGHMYDCRSQATACDLYFSWVANQCH